MIIHDTSTAIVIVGAWNPAILSPEWLVRWAFARQQGEQVQVQMEFSSTPKSSPTFTIEQIVFIPSETKLIVRPERSTEELVARAELAAQRVLENLPHTPIRAFGENFEFTEEHASEADLLTFQFDDQFSNSPELEGLERNEISIMDSYHADNHLVRLTRTLKGNSLNIKLNFHYDTPSAARARELITGTFVQNLNRACRLVAGVYDIPIATILGEAHA